MDYDIIIISILTTYGLGRLLVDDSKLKRALCYVLIVDLLVFALIIYTKSYHFPGTHIIIIYCLVLFLSIVPSLFIVGIISALASIISLAVNRMPWIADKIRPGYKSQTIKNYIVRLVLSEEDEENIIGDLYEEYSQYQPKLTAYWWLVRQVFKSVIPLIYKALKQAVTDKLGAWIR